MYANINFHASDWIRHVKPIPQRDYVAAGFCQLNKQKQTKKAAVTLTLFGMGVTCLD